MRHIAIIFPNQLFEKSPLFSFPIDVYFLIEEYLFFKQYKFHKTKLAYHVATMEFYKNYLQSKHLHVITIPHSDERSDIRVFLGWLHTQNTEKIYVINPVDDWLEKRIRSSCRKYNLDVVFLENPSFLLTAKDIDEYYHNFYSEKWNQTAFYIYFRKKYGVLLDGDKPAGGRWTYDVENRKKLPRHIFIPVSKTYRNTYWDYAKKRVYREFPDNYGEILDESYFPLTFNDAREHLEYFIRYKLFHFGHYQDAVSFKDDFLFHSNLSSSINTGLLTPEEVMAKVLDAYKQQGRNLPLNSVEGFLRQILGWREFIRFIYTCAGVKQRNSNYWNLENRDLIQAFYKRNTGMEIVDSVLQKLHKLSYNHHIERLMILGNVMLLLEIHPEEVYIFFMTHYIDAYDWVMVPNVYGMSQFADGGIMSTKPYISSSSYLMKMADIREKEPSWKKYFDALFWHFLYKHKSKLITNPRMKQIYLHLEKKNITELQKMVEQYKNSLL